MLDSIRDKEVINRIIAEVAGEVVAAANAEESAKIQRQIVRDCLAGNNGRATVSGWVPRWMAFPASSYTERGGVGSAERWRNIAPLLDTANPTTGDEEPTLLQAA